MNVHVYACAYLIYITDMHICICMYVCTHTPIHTYIHTHTHTYIYRSNSDEGMEELGRYVARERSRSSHLIMPPLVPPPNGAARANMHTCVCVCVCVCVCARVCACARAWTHTHTRARARARVRQRFCEMETDRLRKTGTKPPTNSREFVGS